MKKKVNIDVPVEFIPVLDQAKREFKALTGKKKATHADGFRLIAASTRMFKYNKFSFNTDKTFENNKTKKEYSFFKKNKKGFVGDIILAGGALIAAVLVIALVSLILFNFNEKIQNSELVGEQAKEASAYAEGRYGNLLGYGFMALFIGFVLYTIITSVLINNIHPIFWIVGFVVVVMSTIITSTLKMVFGVMETVNILSTYIATIPGATWYFHNIEIINILWMGMQLTILYFTWER